MLIETALSTRERIAAFVDKIDTIATLPEVTARLTAAVNDPKSTAAELHRIIAHDPALVSRILKAVNSSFCGLRSQIDSLERAIIMLGFASVRNIAITATIGKLFSHEPLCADFTARDLWTHSVAVAAAAREMARRVCVPLGEQAFLAGLLHDVGLLVELQVCPHKLREICQSAHATGMPFSTVELDRLGCNHEELGAALAQRWGFPEFCRVAAGCHHFPAIAEPEYRQMAAIIYAADTLCCQDAIGFNLTAVHQVVDTVGFEGHLPLEIIESTRENLAEICSDAIVIFSN
jgi:putative nucleotidyltransferase with HDIG domain